MVKLDCPFCGEEIEEVTYSKKFLFVNSNRYNAAWSWGFTCCGKELLDADLDFHYEVNEDSGEILSTLKDHDGNVILQFWEGVEVDQNG